MGVWNDRLSKLHLQKVHPWRFLSHLLSFHFETKNPNNKTWAGYRVSVEKRNLYLFFTLHVCFCFFRAERGSMEKGCNNWRPSIVHDWVVIFSIVFIVGATKKSCRLPIILMIDTSGGWAVAVPVISSHISKAKGEWLDKDQIPLSIIHLNLCTGLCGCWKEHRLKYFVIGPEINLFWLTQTKNLIHMIHNYLKNCILYDIDTLHWTLYFSHHYEKSAWAS